MSATGDELEALLDNATSRLTYEAIAAAERVLVERGMGAAYGAALEDELVSAGAKAPWKSRHEWNAAIRTAPLEVCLRALARVVREREREKQPKETK